ncbi:MAG: TIGR01212 family radical SAM protein [Desulfobacterales bacterium]|jgi:radical SAM protein (TIGR01212 family)|nr:TIGR01212 family radical SAM protein [Desulfobacterales bacterium]
MRLRYNDLNTHLRGIFGCRVQKITVDAGLTCPNRDGTISTGGCIFCNEKGSGTGAHAQNVSITEQLLQGKKWLSRRYKAQKFIAYFQSFSNTYAPVSQLARLYEEALAVEDIAGLSIGTRPDCVNKPVIDLLSSLTRTHLIWVEYGLQSAHDETLARINRGHTVDCFRKAVRATQGRGIKICAHVILGLPGESPQQMMETAQALSDLGVDGVKIHLLYVVKGTPLETDYVDGRYQCLEQSEYVNLVCRFLEHLSPGIVIQRLTGDPHPDELAAPAWALQRNQTLMLIQNKLEKEGSWQGKYR